MLARSQLLSRFSRLATATPTASASKSSLSTAVKAEAGRPLSILLLSSAYNGMTQAIEKTIAALSQNHKTTFALAESDEAMRKAFAESQPDLVLCPTLMKAIPQDLYRSKTCLIVHPGIKGDRGPSSLDWAILQDLDEWGVTILEADEEMDAGAIWATANFPMPKGASKAKLYNTSVLQTTQGLVRDCLRKFQDPSFAPEKLDYNDPSTKGRLHRTIKLSDPERIVNWEADSTATIHKKALAADSAPGLRVDLTFPSAAATGSKVTRRVFGVSVLPSSVTKPASAVPGQVFATMGEAVCVATRDGAVSIAKMREPKKDDKFASVPHLKEFLAGVPALQ